MTHPFHPLAGEEFDLVVRRHNWAEDRVFFFVGEGELRSVPAGWTDVDAPDPFVVIGAGRSPFRVEDLLSLASVLDGLRPASLAVVYSGLRRSVRGILPARSHDLMVSLGNKGVVTGASSTNDGRSLTHEDLWA